LRVVMSKKAALRVLFPNLRLQLVKPGKNYGENTVAMEMQHNITKIELRNYLKAVYGIEATKVNTMNYDPKIRWKRILNGRKIQTVPGYKKALVCFEDKK